MWLKHSFHSRNITHHKLPWWLPFDTVPVGVGWLVMWYSPSWYVMPPRSKMTSPSNATTSLPDRSATTVSNCWTICWPSCDLLRTGVITFISETPNFTVRDLSIVSAACHVRRANREVPISHHVSEFVLTLSLRIQSMNIVWIWWLNKPKHWKLI